MKNITVYLGYVKGLSNPYIACIESSITDIDIDLVMHGSSYKEAFELALTKANISLMKDGSHPLMMPGITYGDLNGEIVEIRFWKEIGLSDI